MKRSALEQSTPAFFGVLGGLYFADVGRLQTFGALADIKFDHLAFGEGSIAFATYRGIMNEDVLSVILLNKTKSFIVVEPFDFSAPTIAHR